MNFLFRLTLAICQYYFSISG